MGGCVAVTIRESNGKEHRMCRWTNTLPWGINNVKMLAAEPDPAHLAAYLKEWEDMRADWLVNNDTGKFQYNMTDVYGGEPYLAPLEYGLVLVDFKTHTLLTKQGYTSFGIFETVTMGDEWDLYINRNSTMKGREASLGRALADVDSDTRRLADWRDAGRVKGVARWERKRGGYAINEQAMNAKSGYEFLLSLNEYDRVALDVTPFTVIDAEAGEKPWGEVLEMVKGLGFEITPEEMVIWQEHIEKGR